MEGKSFQRKRTEKGKKAGLIGTVINLLLAGGKIFAGSLANSVSVTADGMNHLSDAGSSILSYLGFRLAEKPADKEHPYGHARVEYLTGLVISVMILVIGAELFKSSVIKLLRPEKTEFTGLTAVILGISVFGKFLLSLYQKKMGKEIDSKTLLAAGEDSRNDAVMTSAVLLSGIIERMFEVRTDALTGIPVGLFILFSGLKLAGETVSPILGEGADPEFRKEVERFVLSYDKILGCHDFMLHDYGPGKRFGTIHLEMDKKIGSMESHEIIDGIEKDLLRHFGMETVIHHDPVAADDGELFKMKERVETLLAFRDGRLSVHDFRMEKKDGYTELRFDLVLPHELFDEADEIAAELPEALRRIGNEACRLHITYDRAQGD